MDLLATTCYLCEEPLTQQIPGDNHIFCCLGCRELWRILGDEKIRELKSRPGLKWENLREGLTTGHNQISQGSSPRTMMLEMDGMWCASCSILVEHVLSRTGGVYAAQIDFATSTAKITFDQEMTSPKRLIEAIAKLGYGAEEGHQEGDGRDFDRDQRLLKRFGVSAVMAMFVMMFSVPVWSGYLPQLPTVLSHLLAYGLWLLATPVVFWGGWPFLRGAWSAIRHGIATMDLLIALGSLSAYFYSMYTVLRGGTYLYFDTSTMLVTLLLLSRNLEVGTRRRATELTRMLSRLTVKSATALVDGQEKSVPTEQIRVTQVIVIRPGDRVAVDGTILQGNSTLDQSFLTGEAMPIDKGPGDTVYAGSINHQGRLMVQTLRVADDSILAQTTKFVRNAQGIQDKWQQLADRVLRIFVPSVFGVAILTFVMWLTIGQASVATSLLSTIAVLVIACPCALSVATPLAVLAGAQRLAQNGMLLRSHDALERAGEIDAVLLDKTGTLTEGHMAVAEIFPNETPFIELVASVEAASEHPAALAMVRYAEEHKIPLKPLRDFVAMPGLGVRARIDRLDVEITALRDLMELPLTLKPFAEHVLEAGHTVAQVRIDGLLTGLVSFTDRIRADAILAVRELQAQGLAVWMVTGDNRHTAQMVAATVGINRVKSEQQPIDKASFVRTLQQGGHTVAFVGDGVNDAPALVQADLGIAIGTGSDIALEAGRLTLTRPRLRSIRETFATGKRVSEIIRQNLLWALLYNLVALPAAALGLAYPFVAAMAMVLSSAFVLGNSLRILGWSPRRYAAGASFVLTTVGVLAMIAYLGL